MRGCVFNKKQNKMKVNDKPTAQRVLGTLQMKNRPMGILFNYMKTMMNLVPQTPNQINYSNSRPAHRDQAKQFIRDMHKHPSKCTPDPKWPA